MTYKTVQGNILATHDKSCAYTCHALDQLGKGNNYYFDTKSYVFCKYFIESRQLNLEDFKLTYSANQKCTDSRRLASVCLIGSEFDNWRIPVYDNIIYYNHITLAPHTTNSLRDNIDSEDEPGESLDHSICKENPHTTNDPAWLINHSQFLISEFDDISEKEKTVMNMWNNFIMTGGCKDDSKVGLCVKTMKFFMTKFLVKFRKNIEDGGFYQDVVKFLLGLGNFGHLSTKEISELVEILNRD